MPQIPVSRGKIANEKVDTPSLQNHTVGKRLDSIILKAVERKKELRYRNARTMRQDLDDYLKDRKEAQEGDSSQLKNKSQKTELREACVSSFMSGMIAKELAIDVGLDGTEEAFLCSMLHNLGTHLLLYYFEEEYSQIKDLMVQKGLKENLAARSVLGISYEEIGSGIAKAWKFANKIIKSMKSPPKGKVESPKSEEERP